MKAWIRGLAFPGVLWCAVFLLFNLTNWKGGWNNPDSRYAVLAALYDQHTLRIDRYKDWSTDWARTPDGHYYSNKAPGPTLLAAPLMWTLDELRVLTFGKGSYELAPGGEMRLQHPSLAAKTLVCLVYQLLPFCILALLSLRILRSAGASYAAQNFAIIALMFGNTVDVFMNSFFGHGVAACLLLAAALALYWSSLLFAWPLFRICISVGLWMRFHGSGFAGGDLGPGTRWEGLRPKPPGSRKRIGALGRIMDLVPHCMLRQPVDTAVSLPEPRLCRGWIESVSTLGIAAPIPRLSAVFELVLGPRRGILFTQPWMFPSLVLPRWHFSD